MSFLLKFDLFKRPLYLLFNSHSRLSSHIGVIFSFGIYVLFVIFLLNSNMYLRSSPYVISQTLTGLSTNQIEFNENSHMTFQVVDSNGKFYCDQSIFSISVNKYHIKIVNGTQNIVFFENETLSPCVSQTFNTLTSFCLRNKSFTLSGYVNEIEMQYMSVQLSVCNNLTYNNSCKSAGEISKFFEKTKYFSTNLHSAEINVNDYSKPISIRNNGNFFLIDPKISKNTKFYFKKIEVLSDEGWLYETKQYYSDFKVDYINTDFYLKSNDKTPLFEFIFFASFNYDTVFRRYQKLPEVLGSFAGTSNVILFFCYFFTEINLYISLLKNVLNSLYVFPQLKKEKIKKLCLNLNIKKNSNEKIKENSKKSKILKNKSFESKSNSDNNIKLKEEILIQNPNFVTKESSNLKSQNELSSKPPKKLLNNDSFILDHYSNNMIELFDAKSKDENNNKQTMSPKSLRRGTNIKNSIIETVKKKKMPETFKLSIFEYLKYKLFDFFKIHKNEKQEIIKKAEILYKDHLDIVKILSKIQEIEKIKLILMDDDQLKLFNLLAKPMCCNNYNTFLESSSIALSQRISNYKNENNKESLMTCYEKVFENAKINKISKRIITLVDKNVIEMKEN